MLGPGEEPRGDRSVHRGKKEWGLGYKFTFQILKLNCRQGFQHGASGKELPAMPQIRDASLTPELGRFPGGRHGNTPAFSSGESYGQRSLAGYCPHSHTESDTTEVT